MNKIFHAVMAFLTGGQSDFAFQLSHRWHGVDLYLPLVLAGTLASIFAVICFGLGMSRWYNAKRKTASLAFIASLMLATAAYAASSTLANLSAVSSVGANDLFYDESGGADYKATAAQIAAYVAESGTSGIVTSIATGCQATGGTITTSGTISTQTVINDLSGSNPAITTGYCGQLENLDNSSAQTPTIAVSGSTGFPQSWYTDLCNINTGAQTLTPATGTIGGASTYVLAAGTRAAPNCVRIISDAANTNYVLEFPPGSGGAGGPTLAGNNAWTGANSWSALGQNFSGTGSATAPNIVFGACGVECGIYASGTNDWSISVGGVAIFADTTGNVSLSGGAFGFLHLLGGSSGGAVLLETQNNSGANSSAGNVSITGGNGTGTGTSNGGSVILTAGTTINGTGGTLQFVNLGLAALGSAYLCWNSSGNIVSEDTSCGTSAKDTKNPLGLISGIDALTAIDRMPAGVPVWNYKNDKTRLVHAGLYADDLAPLMKHCGIYEKGKIHGYDDKCVIGFAVAALHELSNQFNTYRATHP